VRRAKVIVRPVHCQVHAADAIAVVRGEPTLDGAKGLMDEAWDAVTKLWLEHGGSPEPGVRERPSLKERLRARSWPGSRR
jgi:hypothetical protein